MFSSSNFPILNELRPRQFSMSITIIIISSSPTSANHAHSLSLSHQTSCQMHEAPQYSFVLENSPVFHRQTEEDESVHTFRGSFFRPGTRGNEVERWPQSRDGAFIRTDKFPAWPGIHTRTASFCGP